MINIIRSIAGTQQRDWATYLVTAEFSYNNSYHSATGMSPIYANYGYHPRIPGFTNRLLDRNMTEGDEIITGSNRAQFDKYVKNLHSFEKSLIKTCPRP